MDLNFQRRARDRAIAREVAEEFLKATKPAFDAGATEIPAELYAHHFGLVCLRHQLGEADATRVFGYVPAAIAKIRREISSLDKKVVRQIGDLNRFARRYG